MAEQLDVVLATKAYRQSELGGGNHVDAELFLTWKVSAKHLIAKACGDPSEHYAEFVAAEKGFYETNFEILKRLKAVFDAARGDFECGLCNSFRNLVQAELFSSELDQATELMSAGYISAAAVIAGVVLETTLRGMCEELGLATGKLDKMNADLAKSGKYNKLMQKRITALADIRNNAAHGNEDQFSVEDVKAMVRDVEQFIAGMI